ncbi:MAG: hypothetical protein ACFCGT_08470 [Sandaracinaceae bacterium]
MAAKRWKLVVSEGGRSEPASETTVEAGNWVSALNLARRAIGEPAGVPRGASVQVDPSGSVLIADRQRDRHYRLSPEAAAPPGPSPEARAQSQRRRASQTIAYHAADLGAGAPRPPSEEPAPFELSRPSSPPASRSEERRGRRALSRTMAYSAADLGLDAPKPPAPPPAAAPPQERDAPPSEPSRAPPPPPRSRRKDPLRQTMAYNAADLGLPVPPPRTPAAAPPEPASEAPTRSAGSRHTAAYRIADLGLPPLPPKNEESPAAPGSGRPAPAGPREGVSRRTVAYNLADLGLPVPGAAAPKDAEATAPIAPDLPSHELIAEIDEEPSEGNPLSYHERVYAVPPGTARVEVEALLQSRFAELQGALGQGPKTRLFQLSVFDHHWELQPRRPALMTLVWKAWKDELVLEEGPALDGSAAAPEAAPDDGRSASAAEALDDLFFLSDAPQAVDFVARVVADLIPCEGCVGGLAGEMGLRIVSACGSGPDQATGAALVPDRGFIGAVWATPLQVLRVDDASRDPRHDPVADASGAEGIAIRNALVVTASGGGHRAVLRLINRDGQPAFDASDANLLAYAARRLGEFLGGV